MPKTKPHKGLLKRVRVTRTGMLRHKAAFRFHLRSHKTAKRLRQLRNDPYCANPDAKRFEKLLFRRLRGRTQPLTAMKRNPGPAAAASIKAERRAAWAAKVDAYLASRDEAVRA